MCDFGDSLNDMLRDRLICGINDARIQRRLLAETKVDFKRTMEIAQAMETADRDVTHLQGSQKELTPTEAAVHVARKPQGVERSRPYTNCHRCGGRHKPSQCKFKEAECYACGKLKVTSPRLAGASTKGGESNLNSQVETMQAATTNAVCKEVDEDVYMMFQLTDSRNDPLYITVSVNQVRIKMEIDTGATLTVISGSTYRQAWTKEQAPPLQMTKTKLRTYTGQEIPVKGSLQVTVVHRSQQKVLPLIVTEGQGPSLLGRNWLGELKLDWKATYRVQGPDPLSAVLDAHEPVFRKELGMIKGMTAKILVDPQVHPCFHKPRPVPFSLRQKVEDELVRLEKEGIIQARQFAD